MFEKNIATSYVAGGELEVPDTVWRALGYEHMAIRKLNNCGNEIIMFHEVSWGNHGAHLTDC